VPGAYEEKWSLQTKNEVMLALNYFLCKYLKSSQGLRLKNKPEADVVEGLVVDAEGLVRVLDQLVHGEGGVVRLDNGIRNLRIQF